MKKVYIIDDDSDFLELATTILGKDYSIASADELDHGHIVSFGPDLILMDNKIGGTDSDLAIDYLKKEIPGFAIPIILVSGHHNLPDIAIKSGVNGYIQKPASIHYIRSYILDFFRA